MDNPWVLLPSKPPFLLPQDEQVVRAYNKTASSNHCIHPEIPPEPYLGHPQARVILLNLNPGFSAHDAAFYKDPIALEFNRKNLDHEETDYPFYLLNPMLPQTTAGPKWWSKKLKALISIAGRKRVARGLCCIEYFPYHSRRYGRFPVILPSQQYNFYLVNKALSQGAIIVLMRSKRKWLQAVPALRGYERLVELNNPQNPALSPRNCPGGFEEIVNVLLDD